MSTHPGKAQVQACQAKPEGKPQAQARSKTVTFSSDVSVSSAGSSWSSHQDKATSLEESYWYTEQETFQMLADTYREALRLSRILETFPESFKNEQQYQSVGIENYIVPNMQRRARQDCVRHSDLILCAQGAFTDTELSILSHTSSARARQRAYVYANRTW